MAIELYACASAEEAEAACAAHCAKRLQSALAASPRTSFIVSGGNTPRRVLAAVLGHHLDWTRVDVFASDERLVPVDHADSTEGMVRAIWEAAGQPLNYVSFGPDTRPDVALATWTAGLKRLTWPGAVAFIGIGDDGHFASLFPSRPEVGDPDLFAAAVPETPPHRHARLTLGRAAFARVGLIVFVAAGDGKRHALAAAVAEGADARVVPAAAIGDVAPAIAFTA